MLKPTDDEWREISTMLKSTPTAVGIQDCRNPKSAIRLLVDFSWTACWNGTKDDKVRKKLEEIEALLDAPC